METQIERRKSVGSNEEAKTTERRRSARLNSSREQQQQPEQQQKQPEQQQQQPEQQQQQPEQQQQQPEQRQQPEQQQQQQSLDNVATQTRLTRKRTCQNDTKSVTQSKNRNGETFPAVFGKKSRKKANSLNQSNLPSQHSLSTDNDDAIDDRALSDESKSNNFESVSNAEGSNSEEISPPVNSDLLLSKSQLLARGESDDDLPEVLTPIDDRISEGDLVWVKYRRNSFFWPALVLRLKFSGKKLQRVKVAFIEYENKQLRQRPFYVRYNPDRIQPIAKNYQRLVIDGKQSSDSVRFKQAIERIEKYIFCDEENRPDAVEFFQIEPKKEEPENIGDGYSIYMTSHLTDAPKDTSTEISDDENSAEVDGSDNEERSLKNKPDVQYSEETRKCIEERCRKEKDLLEHIITSSSVKEHLKAVRLEQIHSTFQTNFKKPPKTRKEQFAIVTQGFGPLRYESILVLNDYLLNFIGELDGQSDRLDSMPYLIDVWIPEAIICGIQEHDGITREKAEEVFRRGIQYTDEETKREAEILIANTTDADREMHKNRSRISRNSTTLCFL